MVLKRLLILLLWFSLTCFSTFLKAQELERRALWQASISAPSDNNPGALIRSINKGSPLAQAGFLQGDLIIRVDGIHIADGEIWSDVSYGLRSSSPVIIEVLRNHQLYKAAVNFIALEKESHTGIDTYYEEVTSTYGITHRTIITRPRVEGKQAAIILIGGLSCSSIEIFPGRQGNWARTIEGLVEKSGMVVMRVEKSGVGDSDGNCGETDFLMDIAGFRAALASLKSKDYVDSNKIVVYGSSMGSAIAPLLANESGLAGVISDGTFFKTWFEHMLEIDRRILQFQGNTEKEIATKLNDYFIPLYYGMLIQNQNYKEVVDQYPALVKYNYHGARHMYGRPVEYYQQLQRYNLAAEWEKVKVPVRILRGTNDWIMSAFDNNMIIEVLKRNGHQDHILYEYPGLDHWNTIHESAKDSFEGKPGEWDEGTIDIILKWAREISGLDPLH